MYTSLTVVNKAIYDFQSSPRGTFTFSDSYPILNIEGVDPGMAEISTSIDSLDAGEYYLSSRVPKRNIVLHVGFNPDYSKGESITLLRRKLYAYLLPTTKIRLEFATERGVLTLDGVVESHESTIFSKDPEVTISILCGYPYFALKGSTWSKYTFASSNVGMGTLSMSYPGEVPVGFRSTFILSKTITTEIGIRAVAVEGEDEAHWRRSMCIKTAFQVGDIVTVSSVHGDKFAQIKRGTTTINAIPYLVGSISLLKLNPGMNYFWENGSGNILEGSLAVEYKPEYAGL